MQSPRFIDQKVRYGLIIDSLPKAPCRILEVGIGEGLLCSILAERGYEVSGCDVDTSKVPELLRQKVAMKAESGACLPYASETFDAVFSCDVLEHVQPMEREAFLTEIIRVCRPGGIISITAFYRMTKIFALWGVTSLLVKRSLPSWYTEYFQIQAPDFAATTDFLQNRLETLEFREYQRSLNLLVFALQKAPDSLRLIFCSGDWICKWIVHHDHWGTPNSAFHTGKTFSKCQVR